MLFGLWVQMGPRNHKPDGVPDPTMESSSFGGQICAPFECDCTAMWPYVKLLWPLVLAALHSRCGHSILPLSYRFLLLSFFFFLACSQRSQIGCLQYFHTWCGLSANLECRSEMCCTWPAEIGRINYAKNRHLCTIAQLCWAISSQLRHAAYRQLQKNLLNSNISHTCPHSMVNVCPLMAEIGWWVWGTSANFNRFSVFASLLHRRRSTEVNHTLHDVWLSPGLVHYIYIFGGCCPLTEFCQVQNSLCIQVLHYSVLAVAARHSSSEHQASFAAW